MALPEVDPNDIVKLAEAFGITLSTAQKQALDVLIPKAQSMLPAGLEARLAAGTVNEATVVSVVEDMIVRVLRNVRGLRQVSIDDYSATIDQAISSGQLYLSPEERARLGGSRRRRVGSIRLAIPPHRVP